MIYIINENIKDIEINQENTKIIYVYLPRKYPPSKIKYIKKCQLEHPEKMKEYREKYEAKCKLDENWKKKKSEIKKLWYQKKKTAKLLESLENLNLGLKECVI